MTCYTIYPEGGGTMFLCGDLGPHCGDAECQDVGTYLCDYPTGDGKTCDMPLCQGHAFEVAPDTHYCPGHALMWREWSKAGVCCWCGDLISGEKVQHSETLWMHPECTEAWDNTPGYDQVELELFKQDRPA